MTIFKRQFILYYYNVTFHEIEIIDGRVKIFRVVLMYNLYINYYNNSRSNCLKYSLFSSLGIPKKLKYLMKNKGFYKHCLALRFLLKINVTAIHIYHTLKFVFFFVFSMDWLPSHRYIHVVPRYGQRLYNENQYVRSHSGYGQPDGAGKGPDHSGRRMRRILYTRR